MTTTVPRIAVILPCYNPGDEIVWTLDSLRAQTVPFRLYLVDDGSRQKPDYLPLLHGLDHELIELEKNIGVCIVRNPAMERALAAGHTYIAQMDCGDWCHPERLEREAGFLDDHPEIALVGSAADILDNDGRPDFVFRPPTEPDAISTGLFYGSTFKHPSMMYRADLVREIGLYSNNYDAAEDYDYLRRADRVAGLANLDDVLIRKVESDNSVSSLRRRRQLFSRLRIQWRYRNLASVHCWLGMLKTLVVLALPSGLVTTLKSRVYGRTDVRGERTSHAEKPSG